jgi:hypothetical protein
MQDRIKHAVKLIKTAKLYSTLQEIYCVCLNKDEMEASVFKLT